MKGGQIELPPPPPHEEKTTLKKPSLILGLNVLDYFGILLIKELISVTFENIG